MELWDIYDKDKSILEKIAKFFVTYLYKENENEISSFIKVNQLCDFNIENEN